MTRIIPIQDVTRLPLPSAVVGESIRWHSTENALFYVDILGQQLRRYDPATGRLRVWDFDEPLGAWFPTMGEDILLGLGVNLVTFDMKAGVTSQICALEKGASGIRVNDGRCDPQGRLWLSTMSLGPGDPQAVGRLYRIAPGEMPVLMMDGLTIPNTLVWSLDGQTMYFADSPSRQVWQFEFDGTTGDLGQRRTFFALDDTMPGIPDGACIDSEGGIWIAMPRGRRLERRMPDGTLDTIVKIPAERPSMCAFGGPDRDILYVTSLSMHIPEGARADRPDEGALFALRPGQTGMPEPLFGG